MQINAFKNTLENESQTVTQNTDNNLSADNNIFLKLLQKTSKGEIEQIDKLNASNSSSNLNSANTNTKIDVLTSSGNLKQNSENYDKLTSDKLDIILDGVNQKTMKQGLNEGLNKILNESGAKKVELNSLMSKHKNQDEYITLLQELKKIYPDLKISKDDNSLKLENKKVDVVDLLNKLPHETKKAFVDKNVIVKALLAEGIANPKLLKTVSSKLKNLASKKLFKQNMNLHSILKMSKYSGANNHALSAGDISSGNESILTHNLNSLNNLKNSKISKKIFGTSGSGIVNRNDKADENVNLQNILNFSKEGEFTSRGESKVEKNTSKIHSLNSKLIRQISNYIEANHIKLSNGLELQVHHDELGDLVIKASKQDDGKITLSILSSQKEGYKFFNEHQNQIVRTLNNKGIDVGSLKVLMPHSKVIQSSAMAMASSFGQSGANNFSNSKQDNSNNHLNTSENLNNFNNQSNSGQFANSGNSSDKGRDRRQNLWDIYKQQRNKFAA